MGNPPPLPTAPAASPLRVAYGAIIWGTLPHVAVVLAEIRVAGWGAVEFFWHGLEWLDQPTGPGAPGLGSR